MCRVLRYAEIFFNAPWTPHKCRFGSGQIFLQYVLRGCWERPLSYTLSRGLTWQHSRYFPGLATCSMLVFSFLRDVDVQILWAAFGLCWLYQQIAQLMF